MEPPLFLPSLASVLRRQEAETTVRAEFEGEAPGILYVADFQGDMDSPYTAEEVRRVACTGEE